MDYNVSKENILEIAEMLDCRWSHAKIATFIIQANFDGAHHKQWVLDQILRYIAQENYDKLIAWANDGEDGPNTYSWDEGIAP